MASPSKKAPKTFTSSDPCNKLAVKYTSHKVFHLWASVGNFLKYNLREKRSHLNILSLTETKFIFVFFIPCRSVKKSVSLLFLIYMLLKVNYGSRFKC